MRDLAPFLLLLAAFTLTAILYVDDRQRSILVDLHTSATGPGWLRGAP
jgi:hypothetical protein